MVCRHFDNYQTVSTLLLVLNAIFRKVGIAVVRNGIRCCYRRVDSIARNDNAARDVNARAIEVIDRASGARVLVYCFVAQAVPIECYATAISAVRCTAEEGEVGNRCWSWG